MPLDLSTPVRHTVAMPEENWDRLAEFVSKRMDELDLTQAQIQQRGGPSPAKVREITSRRTSTMSPSKRRDLERALDWGPGSIDRVLAGGEPKEKLQPSDPTATAPPPVMELGHAVMDDLINTVGRTRNAPAIDRATEIFRVIAASVNITRNTLVHETGAASREHAINSIYAATNAIPYMREALEEIKRGQHDVEASADAPAEGLQSQEVTRDMLDLAARRVERDDKPE